MSHWHMAFSLASPKVASQTRLSTSSFLTWFIGSSYIMLSLLKLFADPARRESPEYAFCNDCTTDWAEFARAICPAATRSAPGPASHARQFVQAARAFFDRRARSPTAPRTAVEYD